MSQCDVCVSGRWQVGTIVKVGGHPGIAKQFLRELALWPESPLDQISHSIVEEYLDPSVCVFVQGTEVSGEVPQILRR
jgi:hypothetical protein